MLLSDTIVDFHLFYDGVVDIQIWALLTRSECEVSDTQVTVKACGSLVYFCTATKNIITATLDLLASNDEYAMRVLGNKWIFILKNLRETINIVLVY